MCQRKHQLSDRGFSVIEVIVVVAIMSVMIGVISITYTVVKKANVTKAAKAIDNLLTTCREKAMTNSAKEWKVVIDGDSAVIIKVDSEGNESEVASETIPSNVDVYVIADDGVSQYYASDNPISISFKLLSGEVSSVYTTGVTIKGSGTQCQIVSDYKNKKHSTIILYYATGKHTVD